MHKFNIKKQVGKLYGITAIGYFQIAGASWVALQADSGPQRWQWAFLL